MKNWLPLVVIAGLLLLRSKRASHTEPIMPIGTVPSYMIGTVPSGTPVDSSGNVLLRNKYTHITTWVPYFSVPEFLMGDWVYG